MNRQHIRLALLLSILFIGTTGVESQSAPKSAEKNEMKDSMALSPNRKWIAIGNGDGRVRVIALE